MKTEKVVVQRDSKGEFVDLEGLRCPATGYATVRDEQWQPRGRIPILDVPQISDYKWQLDCLKSRLAHPEHYPDEDVPATIEYLRQWLAEHSPDDPPQKREYQYVRPQNQQGQRKQKVILLEIPREEEIHNLQQVVQEKQMVSLERVPSQKEGKI